MPAVPESPIALRVRTESGAEDQVFASPFYIGRGEDCQVRIQHDYVSRRHAEVAALDGQWIVRDLGSSNGIFVDGVRVPEASVGEALTIRLGIAGPFVHFEAQRPALETAPALPPASTAAYVARYFEKPGAAEAVGEHTQMVRRAFQQVQKKQTRKYRNALAALLVLVVGTAAFAWYQHRRVAQQTEVAKEIFYSMKAIQVDLANLENLVQDSRNPQAIQEVHKYQSRRREMEKNYDRFLAALHVYDSKMTEQQRLILRVARIFGECELDVPPGFLTEVESYIKKWQSSSRLKNAIKLANEKGYTARIARELLLQNLPPQFFYLALQESNFDAYISGPPTYKGIAKGMWQFIPETAVKYGLHIGPLAEFRRPDPADDRHNWEKETVAAAQYLKDIYSTDAQASGLLVIASYNWGEQRVLPIIRSMPANPRERNFWRLITLYRTKVPKETYDYVYYIVSAAAIGENPRLFGFDFNNPLGTLETR